MLKTLVKMQNALALIGVSLPLTLHDIEWRALHLVGILETDVSRIKSLENRRTGKSDGL